MSIIIFGLQYDAAMNFYELFVRGITVDAREREALKAELKEGYRDWLSKADHASEIRLKTRLNNVSPQTMFSLLVLPSPNERFKNVYLIGSSSKSMGPPARTAASKIGERNSGGNEQLVADLLAGNPEAIKFAQGRLSELLASHLEMLPKLLLLGAAVFHQQTRRSLAGMSDSSPAPLRQTPVADSDYPLTLSEQSKHSSIMGRAFSRLRRNESGSDR